MQRLRFIAAAIAATASIAANAATFSTDDARAEVSQRNQAAEHAASLQPITYSAPAASTVTDSDSARRAAEAVNTQRAHDSYLAAVQGAESGATQTVRVFDTDSARAAAAQANRQQELVADHADYVKTQAQASQRAQAVN